MQPVPSIALWPAQTSPTAGDVVFIVSFSQSMSIAHANRFVPVFTNGAMSAYVAVTQLTSSTVNATVRVTSPSVVGNISLDVLAGAALNSAYSVPCGAATGNVSVSFGASVPCNASSLDA